MNNNKSDRLIKNTVISVICRLINVLFGFAVRTVFIKTLSTEYLGVNGLFANILMVLSFAELGIGHAITFSLYKPLADNDKIKISQIMNFMKLAYRIIAIIVFSLGILAMPFLNWLVDPKQIPNIPESIHFIFFLFIINNALSYLLVYKQTLLIADQKQYKILFYNQIVSVIFYTIQCLILYFSHNYIFYLIAQIIFALINNLVLSRIAQKEYPFLNEYTKDKLEKQESKEIFKNVRSVILFKLSSIFYSSSDNIIIAKLINVVTVGLVSQYTLILSTLNTILSQIIQSVIAALGNVGVTEDEAYQKKVFYQLLFFGFWVFGFISSGIFLFIDDLIGLWLGKEYLLDNITVLSLSVVFLLDYLNFPTSAFRQARCLFRQAIFIPIIGTVFNVFLSILLGIKFGLPGIYFATAIARLLSTTLIDPIIVCKHCFNSKPYKYYVSYFVYVLITVLYCFISYIIISLIPFSGIVGFIIKLILFTLIYNGLVIVVFHKNSNFLAIKAMLLKLFKKNKKGDNHI